MHTHPPIKSLSLSAPTHIAGVFFTLLLLFPSLIHSATMQHTQTFSWSSGGMGSPVNHFACINGAALLGSGGPNTPVGSISLDFPVLEWLSTTVSGNYTFGDPPCNTSGSNTCSGGQCFLALDWCDASAALGSASISCSFTYLADCGEDCPQTLPYCGNPIWVPASNCDGGNALWGTSLGTFELMFGPAFASEPSGIYFVLDFPESSATGWGLVPHITEDIDIIRPDGSSCHLLETGEDYYSYNEYFVCPTGFKEDPSSSSSDNVSSSSIGSDGSSSSDTNGGASSSSRSDLCTEFPSLPGCDGSGGDGGSSGSGGDGSGGNCSDLSNCDWAKLDVQITQLGVSVDIRNEIRNMSALAQAGYNLTKEQNTLLQGVVNAVNSGNINAVNAINSGALGTINAINNLSNGIRGSVSDGVSEALDKFTKDTTGNGDIGGLFGTCEGDYCSTMGDRLGDGSAARGKWNSSLRGIGIDSTSFGFLGTSGTNCPIIPMKFDVGFYGIKNDNDLNLCNVYGYNVAQTLRAVLWLIVLIGCFFSTLDVIRSGGHS